MRPAVSARATVSVILVLLSAGCECANESRKIKRDTEEENTTFHRHVAENDLVNALGLVYQRLAEASKEAISSRCVPQPDLTASESVHLRSRTIAHTERVLDKLSLIYDALSNLQVKLGEIKKSEYDNRDTKPVVSENVEVDDSRSKSEEFERNEVKEETPKKFPSMRSFQPASGSRPDSKKDTPGGESVNRFLARSLADLVNNSENDASSVDLDESNEEQLKLAESLLEKLEESTKLHEEHKKPDVTFKTRSFSQKPVVSHEDSKDIDDYEEKENVGYGVADEIDEDEPKRFKTRTLLKKPVLLARSNFQQAATSFKSRTIPVRQTSYYRRYVDPGKHGTTPAPSSSTDVHARMKGRSREADSGRGSWQIVEPSNAEHVYVDDSSHSDDNERIVADSEVHKPTQEKQASTRKSE